jgi:DNA-directed RNA polymerase
MVALRGGTTQTHLLSTFEEKVRWVDKNAAVIQATAETTLADRRWFETDKPFLFLAACMELVIAQRSPGYITRLPVSLKAVCNIWGVTCRCRSHSGFAGTRS